MSPREGVLTSLRNHHHTRLPTFVSRQASAVPHPSIPSPPPRTLFPSRVARGSFPAAQPHPTSYHREEGERSRGEVGMFRRDIRVSDAKRGRVPCRSKEHTASTRPTEPNHRIQSKTKPPYRTGKGAERAADGNRTRVSGLGSVRSTIELQPHLFQCIALACRG